MLKYLPRSGMEFLLHIFNLSWTLYAFSSIWKTSSVIPINKMGKTLHSHASIRHIFITSCVSKLFERIVLSRLLFFLESNSIISPHQAGFRPGRSTLDQVFIFLSPSWIGLTNPGRAFRRFSLLSISRKLLTLSDISLFPINSFWLASLFALLVGLHLSFLIGALGWFIKITKVVPFESDELFSRIRSWPYTFLSFHH